VLAEVLTELEVELVLAATSRPASRASDPRPSPLRAISAPNCSSTRTPAASRGAPSASAASIPSYDHALRVGDRGRLLLVRLALHAEELLLERAAVVEREDVERVPS
jgi:hypothetical protein